MATLQGVQAIKAEELKLALDGGSFVPYYEQIVNQVPDAGEGRQSAGGADVLFGRGNRAGAGH